MSIEDYIVIDTTISAERELNLLSGPELKTFAGLHGKKGDLATRLRDSEVGKPVNLKLEEGTSKSELYVVLRKGKINDEFTSYTVDHVWQDTLAPQWAKDGVIKDGVIKFDIGLPSQAG